MSLKITIVFTVVLFSLFSMLIFVMHEQQMYSTAAPHSSTGASYVKFMVDSSHRLRFGLQSMWNETNIHTVDTLATELYESVVDKLSDIGKGGEEIHTDPENPADGDDGHIMAKEHQEGVQITDADQSKKEQLGTLTCNGTQVKSEVIYWKVVPGDNEFESPITPHHDEHHDRYLTFEYDNGGWNNMRMGIECLIVCAHAMGRTIVLPPSQHLYLLTQKHKDDKNSELHSEMGFEDFFNIDILKSHKGFHVLMMKDFLQKEGMTGGLKGRKPPNDNVDLFGNPLWRYLESVADVVPAWAGHFVAFPDRPGDFNFSGDHHPRVKSRLKSFSGDRPAVYYDEKLQQAHHIHFSGRDKHRILQHHYGA